MPTHRVIRSALNNFLGSYTSRNSDYRGYWLFGIVEQALSNADFDLLARPFGAAVDDPLAAAAGLAAAKFQQQVQKAGLSLSLIRSARLHIRKLPEPVDEIVNGRPTSGHKVRFCATAVMDNGRMHERERTLFVAPHDARHEYRSTREWNR